MEKGNNMAQSRKFTFPEALWAGTEHSLTIASEAHDFLMAGMFDAQPAAEPTPVPYNFSLQGNVGVITIAGPLVNNDSPYNQYRGVTSYSDIRRAMIYASLHESVQAIMLDINSGGGAVSGCADCAALIASIDKGVKPVYAFTDGMMASAAYWLGSSARGVYVSQTAMTGSIGVISTHMEYSKLLKEAGIGVTVMRAGEYKALVNSMEPLSDVAKMQMQDQLNAAYGVFISHVAEARGTSVALADKTMGQGREFFGAAAVDANLADGVRTFDSTVSMISEKAIDTMQKKDHTGANHTRGLSMPRQALTEQAIAAMAAGAAMGAEAATEAELAAAAAAATEAEAAAAAAAEAEAAAAAAATEAAAIAAAPAADANLVSYLQGQIKDKDAAFLAQSVELQGLKTKLAGMEATHDGLVKIAAQSVSTMKVALGHAKGDFNAMAPELLLAEHAATSDAFTKAFKVGGVAAVKTVELKEEANVPDSLHMARIAATRFPIHTK